MNTQRAANFEFLRIIAMFGVVVNHFYNNALNIYDPTAEGLHIAYEPSSNLAIWAVMEIMKLVALVSVNCYVLMTGFFMAGKTDFRIRGMWNVWSQTWFYSVALWLLMMWVGGVGFSISDMIHYLTPVCTNNYWFITNYLGLMLVAPFLSSMVSHIERRQFRMLIVVGGIICLQYPFGHIFVSPQQFLLFIYLYIIGAYIRLHVGDVSLRSLFIGFALTLTVMLAVAVVKNIVRGDGRFDIIAMEYHGLVLPLSVFIFLIFRGMKIPTPMRRPVLWLAPLSLAVYLIHEHPLVDGTLWPAVRSLIGEHPLWWLPIDVLTASTVIYIVCVAIDMVRHYAVKTLAAAAGNILRRYRQ